MPDLDALARSAAVIVPASGRDTLVVTGPDRRSWLEGLVTCELKNLAPGGGTWGLVLNRQGKIQSEVWVLAGPEALWLSFAPGTGAAMAAELGRMLIMEDAELDPPEQPQAWLSLHGPEAAARAARCAGELGGVAASIDFTGLGGAALVVPAARAADVLARSPELTLDEAGWTRLRLERNLPEYGVDYDGLDRPHEAALDRRAVSWTKGCYLGQEVVCMQDMRGKVKRSARVLRLEAPEAAPIRPGARIVAAAGPTPGSEVGTVTSRAYSPRAGGWLVMAKLQLDALAHGVSYHDAAGAYPAHLAEPV